MEPERVREIIDHLKFLTSLTDENDTILMKITDEIHRELIVFLENYLTADVNND